MNSRATLTIGADGRSAVTRDAARLPRLETSPPIDVFWFRLPRRHDEFEAVFGRLGPGLLLVMLDRNDYWQVAFVIAKGKGDEIRARGLDAFRSDIVRVAPELADRVGQLSSWDEVKLLTVRVDRLTQWHKPGYLAIGDAAHAMSPVGGVGINVAIQDAVAAANVLWRPLSDGRVSDGDLAEVQRRRERAVKVIQGFQGFVQNRFLKPALMAQQTPSIPWIVRLVLRIADAAGHPAAPDCARHRSSSYREPCPKDDDSAIMPGHESRRSADTWLDYHYWARDLILDAVAPLSAEQFTRPIESSFKSVRDTVAHIVWRRVALVHSGGPANRQRRCRSTTCCPTSTSIKKAWLDHEVRLRAFVNDGGEEGVNRVYDYKSLSGAADVIAVLGDARPRRQPR